MALLRRPARQPDNDQRNREPRHTSAWDYLLLGAVSLCLEQQLEPTDLVPGGYAKAVGTAEGTWRSCERLGLTRQGR